MRSKLLCHCTLGATLQNVFLGFLIYIIKIVSTEYQTITSVKSYKPGTTVQKKQKQISNQVQRYHMPSKQITQKIQTHTGGLSENCSRLQSLCRHHFGDWQGYFEALGDAPSQLNTHHVAHSWWLEQYIRATLLHCQFCATHLFEDCRVCLFSRKRRSWQTDVRCSNLFFGLESWQPMSEVFLSTMARAVPCS